MAEPFEGVVDIRDSASHRRTIQLLGDDGMIFVGGNETSGIIFLYPEDGVYPQLGTVTVALSGGDATLAMGGNERRGTLLLFPEDGRLDHSETATVALDGRHANLRMGGSGEDGDIVLQGTGGESRIRLDAEGADIYLGGNGRNGDHFFYSDAGDGQTTDQATIRLHGGNGNLVAGGSGQDGDIVLRGTGGENRIHLDAGGGDIHLGGNGRNGDLWLYSEAGDGQTTGQATIRLDGREGDIILQNADCAEDFDLAEAVEIAPGTLMVLNHEGKLEPSSTAYDRKVVGIVAGAGNYRPGIVLGHKNGAAARVPISVLGKASCKADASYGPIEVGDLLTTSPTRGHAMKASDPQRGFGSVTGKALTPLREGVGLVDVLITLQ